MSSEKFLKAGELFHSALDLPPEDRIAYIKKSCDGDESLLHEVETLLEAHQSAEGFMQKPAFEDLDVSIEDQLTEGQLVGPYKIIRVIGRGGMGAVYLAARADERFEKSVAIKLIKRGMATDDILRRFRNEQQILGNLDHPNIAGLLDAGSTENGLPYFIMEYVEGLPIDQYCDQQSLSITRRLELFQQVCSAVSYAHRNLVVHRDIKPSNILVTETGVPKLLDFGVAKILQTESVERSTMTGMHFMTPEYASPEQAQGQQVTTLSDVYSLGVLLYELLTGHFPYPLSNRTPIEILRTITETQPQLPSTIILHSKDDEASKTREGSPERLRKRLRGDLDKIVLMALRKEPQRRYQSVDQLSEDIRRHLSGLPITAHKDTILYRGSRFILRNRVASTIVLLSLLALGLSAAIMQWRGNKQARLFQEFGQEVTRIEAFMRYAYLLPMHNIERDKKHVTDRLAYIKKRMETMGSISYGPGYYSLGRGYLSLHQYQNAYDNLILAWQKYQYQEPTAANALGLSMALLYQEKVFQAEQLYSKEELKKRKSELEKLYLIPALHYIQKGENASESPEYVQALVAFLQKKYPQALEKARAAEEQISWHYESKKLQGNVFEAMGSEEAEAGNLSESFELYGKAKLAYLEATKKGESDPEMYEALCHLQARIQKYEIDLKRKSSEEGVEEAANYCRNALQVDSRNINANLTASAIYKDWAFYKTDHGEDPSVPVEKSLNFARAALKIDPENALAHTALGEAYSTRSNWETIRGRDPIVDLELADASYTKAVQKIPEDYSLLFLLANNSIKRAIYYYSGGKDPRPALQKTIDISQKLTQLQPKNFRYFGTLGHAYHVKGQYEYDVGLDPIESLNKSIHFFKQSVSLNRAYTFALIWCGNSYLVLGEHYINVGGNSIPSFDEAVNIFGECLKQDPENFWAQSGLGIALSRKGLVLQQEGKDPTTALKISREAFKKALQLENSIVSIYSYSADAELIGARYAISRGISPESYLKESEQIVQACLKINADSDECLGSLAQMYSLRAEHLVSQKQSAEREISIGLEHADHALKVNSGNASAMAYRGKLFLIRAQSASGDLRQQDAQTAVESFNKAFKSKISLQKQYGKYLEEAKQLLEM